MRFIYARQNVRTTPVDARMTHALHKGAEYETVWAQQQCYVVLAKMFISYNILQRQQVI